jgi:hypothetical protein
MSTPNNPRANTATTGSRTAASTARGPVPESSSDDAPNIV